MEVSRKCRTSDDYTNMTHRVKRENVGEYFSGTKRVFKFVKCLVGKNLLHIYAFLTL